MIKNISLSSYQNIIGVFVLNAPSLELLSFLVKTKQPIYHCSDLITSVDNLLPTNKLKQLFLISKFSDILVPSIFPDSSLSKPSVSLNSATLKVSPRLVGFFRSLCLLLFLPRMSPSLPFLVAKLYSHLLREVFPKPPSGVCCSTFYPTMVLQLQSVL